MKKNNTSRPRPKVTVVVPIYNVERYLKECVDSILRQTLKDIEVILVDDGSPDKCGEMIDQYAKKDKRVIAVHQKNSGYSTAVNKGIDMARGEYIGIIESDDWIEADMYESLYDDAKKNDTDVTKGCFYYYNSTLASYRQDTVFKNPCGIDLMLAPSGAFKAVDWPKIIGFHASIWSSIYRADFVKRIKIPETAGASYQDFPFMIQVMTEAERISVVKRPFVHWRNDPKQGNSTSAGGEKLLLMAKNTQTGLKILQDSGQYNDLKEPFFAHALWTNIGFFYRISFKYKKEYYTRLRNIFSVIKNDPDFHYTYFRPEDKVSVKALLRNGGWPIFQISHLLGGIKRRLKRFIVMFFPTYRAVTFLKEKLSEMDTQNMILQNEVHDVKLQLDKIVEEKIEENSTKN